MTTEVNRGYLEHIKRWSRPSRISARGIVKQAIQLVLVPFLILFAFTLAAGLRLALHGQGRGATSELHEDAATLVSGLVEQYPLHLYPIVAKSLELAYLKKPLDSLLDGGASVLEVAIGEGTLSARAFGARGSVTGLDLNPHSLAKAAMLPHVVRAIVGDGLNPPMRPGSFDLVLSLNFLHHVTDKGTTLVKWGQIGRTVLFNENTPFWATGWPVSFVLKRLGFSGLARRYAARIEERSMQRLVDRTTLERQVRTAMPIVEETSFLSEPTFFLCGLFSFLMLCYGPPTPAILKRVFLGVLRPIALPLTARLAALLLKFDSRQDRATDTFVFFKCDGSREVRSDGKSDLACPRCSTGLSGTRCVGCGAVFPEADAMLFLLPEPFEYVFDDYARHEATGIPEQHL